VILIPPRYFPARLSDEPAEFLGKPMVQHAYERALEIPYVHAVHPIPAVKSVSQLVNYRQSFIISKRSKRKCIDQSGAIQVTQLQLEISNPALVCVRMAIGINNRSQHV
jgi:hypothetical protein